MAGRPRLEFGTFGAITTTRTAAGTFLAQTRYRDDDGKVRRVKATAPTAAAAEAELKRRIRDRSSVGTFGASLHGGSPFAELAAQWLASIEADPDLARGTKQTYGTHLRTLLMPTWQDFTLREITTARAEKFIQAQRQKSYSKAQHSKTTLRMVMAYAVRQGAIDRNPVESTSRMRKPPTTPKALTPEEIEQIREAARVWRSEPGPGPRPDGQVRDIIEVMLGSATRIGEALALRRKDVDMSAHPPTIAITGTIVTHRGEGNYRQEKPKTDKSYRTIAIPAFAAEVIRRRLAVTAGEAPEHLLFFSRRGTPLWPSNVRSTFREMLELAGLEGRDIRPHSFRKTGATLVSAAAGDLLASELLGHTNTSITRAHYVERSNRVNPATAELLGQLAPKPGSDSSD